ncbi:MAG: trypsin-like peptidase domain-containing protein [bacterium]
MSFRTPLIHHTIRALVLSIMLGLPLTSLAGIDRQRQSVAKIYVTVQQEDFRQPWQSSPPMSGNGSGFIIKGKRLMTNAHVVSDARFIEVQREGDTRKFPAHVRFIAHDCDIAVLEVNDEAFFEGTKPLTFGTTLPSLNDAVIVLGYPMGGGRLSLTKGVVSRIDYNLYAHSSIDSHLVMQVDAAINPGNSGGPVLFDNKVIGIAFQGIEASQNIGYTIPLPVIEHFLKDIDDGTYDGYPELGVDHLRTENPALRVNLGLPNGSSGVVVANVDPYGAAAGLLKPRDVLLAIDGHPIANDGSVRLDNNTVEYTEFVERKQCTESINFTIWREDQTLAIVVPLRRKPDPFIFRQTYDQKPEYFIAGGLIFSPLSRGYLATLGTELNTPPAQHLLYTARYAKLDNLIKDRSQFVLLTGRLPHPVNTYCTSHFNQILASVNGQLIRSIGDLPEALKKPVQGFHVFRFEGQDDPLIMDAGQAAKADSEILTHYSIPSLSRILPAQEAK